MQFYRPLNRHPSNLTLAHPLRTGLLILAAYVAPVLAQDGCPPRPTSLSKTSASEPSADLPVSGYAQRIRALRGGTTELEGDAELAQGGTSLSADTLRYHAADKTADASGTVRFRNTPGDEFRSDSLRLNLDTREGETGPAQFQLRQGLGRGDAQRIEFNGPDRTTLHDLRFTTCREGQDDWFLGIGRLELDTREDIGTARHATVRFFDVPLFYFPYVNFPISDRRKSGFLFPTIGHSDRRGYEVQAPYYLNLAPNYDATITPHLMSRRSAGLQNEFRYLTSSANGEMHLDLLPNDRVTGDDRYAGSLRHRQNLGAGWTAAMDLRRVSDDEYFDDFGDHLNLTTQSFLARTAALQYQGAHWRFLSRVNSYQTIDPDISTSAEPYARLPQLLLTYRAPSQPRRPHFELESEWNRFDHPTLLTGDRLNVNLGVGLPLRAPWGFLTPRIGARHIGYRLDREQDPAPDVTRGVFSVDGGLFFERDTAWGERPMLQTLEPRLFYLRVPHAEQDHLPRFDTSLPDFSFAALFRENRFVGGDRIGDANQLTAALTTRFIDAEEGVERVRLSVGRIHYFADREVNLPGGTQTAETSDYVAEASLWLAGNWHVRETLQWRPDAPRTQRSTFFLQYQPAADRIVSLGHVYERDRIEQIDASLAWPLTPRWAVRARALYSTREERNIESYAGVEYNACCWALRVFAARRWQDDEQVNSINLQLQLTGLSQIGAAPANPLEQGLFFSHRD